MHLRDYLIETKKAKEAGYIIRTIVDITDTMMDKIEECLQGHGAVSVSAPKSTPMQVAWDFSNAGLATVNIIEVVLARPVTPAQLLISLVEKVGIPESQVRVYNDKDPVLEAQNDKDEKTAKKPKYKARLLDDAYSEHKVTKTNVGDKHSDKLNNDFAKNRKSLQQEYKIKR